jgi:hypothetical protein
MEDCVAGVWNLLMNVMYVEQVVCSYLSLSRPFDVVLLLRIDVVVDAVVVVVLLFCCLLPPRDFCCFLVFCKKSCWSLSTVRGVDQTIYSHSHI